MSYSVYQQTARLAERPAGRGHAAGRPGRPGLCPAAAPGRSAADLWTGNQMILAGWHRADGYAGLEPRRQLDYASLPALQAAAASWVQRDPTTAQIAGLVPRGDDWLQVPGTLPRVRLVTQAVASRDPARDIGRIDLHTTALTELPVDAAGRLENRRGRPAVSRSVPAEWKSPSTRPAGNCWWFPKVIIPAGRRRRRPAAAGLRVNGDFIGCVVGPGKQNVLLEFRPAQPPRRAPGFRRADWA